MTQTTLMEKLVLKMAKEYQEAVIDIKVEHELFMGEEIMTAYYHSFKKHTIYKGMLQCNITTNEHKFTHDIMH